MRVWDVPVESTIGTVKTLVRFAAPIIGGAVNWIVCGMFQLAFVNVTPQAGNSKFAVLKKKETPADPGSAASLTVKF